MKAKQLNDSINRYWLYLSVSMIPGILLLYAVSSSTIVEFLTQINQDFTKTEVIKTLATLALSLTIVAGLLSRLLYLPRCVLCDERITPKESSVIIATKNCTHCGETIINNS